MGRAPVAQDLRFDAPVSRRPHHPECLVQKNESLPVLAHLAVDEPDVASRDALPQLIADLALDGQRLPEVLERFLMLAPQREDFADVRQEERFFLRVVFVAPQRKSTVITVEGPLILPEQVIDGSQVGERLRLARAVSGVVAQRKRALVGLNRPWVVAQETVRVAEIVERPCLLDRLAGRSPQRGRARVFFRGAPKRVGRVPHPGLKCLEITRLGLDARRIVGDSRSQRTDRERVASGRHALLHGPDDDAVRPGRGRDQPDVFGAELPGRPVHVQQEHAVRALQANGNVDALLKDADPQVLVDFELHGVGVNFLRGQFGGDAHSLGRAQRRRPDRLPAGGWRQLKQ
jgi:hypothetical protein